MNLKHNIYRSIVFSFLTLISTAPTKAAQAKTPDQKSSFTIVIDAGHGGHDSGAVDNNVKEKDINLGVAKKLAGKIKKNLPEINVVLTRDNDSYLTLQDRANKANENKGNLFISIHTNSVDKTNPNRNKVSGASVYALGLHKDQSNLQVAMRENSVIELEKNFEQKYSGFDPSKDESYIIFEMAQKKNLGQSLKFADLAQKSLVKEAGRADRGVKQAGFWVLWATSMPAVLVELDFICNPNSAVFLGSEVGQEQLAEALFKAVEKYIGKSDTNSQNSKALAAAEDNENVNPAIANQTETPVLKSSQSVNKTANQKADESRTAITTAAKRKRRSDAARKVSAERVVEVSDITLHDENERLAVVEAKPQEVIVAVNDDIRDNKKSGKSKNKSKAKKAEAPKQTKQTSTSRTYNNKVVVLNSDGSTALADNNSVAQNTMKTHKPVSGYHSRVEKLTTVYKIQILACAELLKQNNPMFCGLSPIRSFKENNIYKYTYGESRNRQEMEALLKKVKEKIPDAFIIKSQI